MNEKFHFSSATWENNSKRLTNQIFKILGKYDHGENWEKQQETVLLEFLGYNDALQDNVNFMILIGKLYALSHAEDQITFRKLVFEAITELKTIQM